MSGTEHHEDDSRNQSLSQASEAPLLTNVTPIAHQDSAQHGDDDSIHGEQKVASNVNLLAEQMNSAHVHNGSQTPPAQTKQLPASPPPPEPPSESEKPYSDPTPKTPTISRRPSGQDPTLEYDEKEELRNSEAIYEKQKDRAVADDDSTSEIQSIMDQFTDETVAPTKEEIMSPRHEIQNPILSLETTTFPQRRSSLEPLRARDMDAIAQSPVASSSEKFPNSPPPVPPKPDMTNAGINSNSKRNVSNTSLPPPEPEPELPFDFHRFLEQLRHKSADPVAKFLRSFLTEFGKKQWLVHEQVKIISDFLAFITNKMAVCDVWRDVSDNEFDNAKEGMEKLVMNRLYSQTFSPAIPPPPQAPRSRSRGKRKELEKLLGPGRRGQHQEDVERDDILTQKIRIYSWVKEEHLDIPPVGPNGERFLRLAQQELLKIKSYRAPRDKVVCVLNCCKVIFGLLKNAQSSDTSADSFIPLLIYVVLQANPDNLVSNIQYILRFRNQDKLGGEAGYYLSSLSGAIQFIENLDRTTLTISDEEFEKYVEQSVSAIAEQHREQDITSPRTPYMSEKSALSEAEVTPRNSLEVTATTPRRTNSKSNQLSTIDGGSDDAVGGLLRTIQKPLSTIGRIFGDQDVQTEYRGRSPTPQRKLSPSVFPAPNDDGVPQAQAALNGQAPTYDAQEAAARQASAEAAEARRIQRAEHRTVVDTLCGMFPNLDRDIIDDVVLQKQGRVGLAVDACLGLTAGG